MPLAATVLGWLLPSLTVFLLVRHA
jgi:hypothetical protein